MRKSSVSQLVKTVMLYTVYIHSLPLLNEGDAYLTFHPFPLPRSLMLIFVKICLPHPQWNCSPYLSEQSHSLLPLLNVAERLATNPCSVLNMKYIVCLGFVHFRKGLSQKRFSPNGRCSLLWVGHVASIKPLFKIITSHSLLRRRKMPALHPWISNVYLSSQIFIFY